MAKRTWRGRWQTVSVRLNAGTLGAYAMDIVVRRAEAGDTARMAALSAEVQALHAGARPDHFRSASAEELMPHLEQLLRDGSSMVWVAERADSLLAVAVVRVRETVAGPYLHARTWWELEQLCVGPAHRSSGVGRALVERIQTDARAAAISSVELTCWSFNHEALLAFSKLGFRSKLVRLELVLGCILALVGCASQPRPTDHLEAVRSECRKPSETCVQMATKLLKTHTDFAVQVFADTCAAKIASGCAELGHAYAEGGVLPQDGKRADDAYAKACRLDPLWCD
jgi:GNAT superfamily N-acetyltransferase